MKAAIASTSTTRASAARRRNIPEHILQYSIMTAIGCAALQFAPSDWFATLASDGSIIMTTIAAVATPERVATAQVIALRLLPMAVATGLPALVATIVSRRWRRQVARVTEAVAAAMHATSAQATVLTVRFRRTTLGRPLAITIRHPPAIDTTDHKVATAMEGAVTRVIGGHWKSRPDSLNDRTTLRRLPPEVITQSEELDGPVERVSSLFRTSLGSDVTVRNPYLDSQSELKSFRVDYKPRLAVAVPAFRARLDNHLSQLLSGRWVGSWELQNDTVLFTRRPELDRKVPYPLHDVIAAAASARHRFMLEVCQTVNADVARWNLNGKVPHALFTGETGGGKTFAEIVTALSALLRGFKVRIADPKRIEFLQLEQWPGVLQVAKTPEDIVDVIERVFALMERRYSEIEQRLVRREDLVPEVVILDEWYVLRQRLNGLWRAGGEDGKPRRGDHPALGLVAELLALARAARIHLLLGIQRPDASNFPAGARDNARFRLSLGRLSPEGATMMWDSPYIGTDIPDDIAGRGTVRSSDGPVEAHVYWLPNLDLHVPDSELTAEDAAFRTEILQAVTLAQQAEDQVLDSTPTDSETPEDAPEPSSRSTGSTSSDESYDVINSVPLAAVKPGDWIVVDDPEIDGRQIPAAVETIEDGEEEDTLVIGFVTRDGALGEVELDRSEYVDLMTDPT